MPASHLQAGTTRTLLALRFRVFGVPVGKGFKGVGCTEAWPARTAEAAARVMGFLCGGSDCLLDERVVILRALHGGRVRSARGGIKTGTRAAVDRPTVIAHTRDPTAPPAASGDNERTP